MEPGKDDQLLRKARAASGKDVEITAPRRRSALAGSSKGTAAKKEASSNLDQKDDDENSEGEISASIQKMTRAGANKLNIEQAHADIDNILELFPLTLYVTFTEWLEADKRKARWKEIKAHLLQHDPLIS